MAKRLKVLQRTGISAFVLGVVSSIFASFYYKALDTRDYKIVAILSLAVTSIVLLVISAGAIHSLLRQNVTPATSAIVPKTGPDRLDFDAFVQQAQRRVDFMGIIAKRSVNSDNFKAFLASRRDMSFEFRFLLLDPKCSAFAQRAADENESADAWLSDLQATVSRLFHYAVKYNISVKIRLYNLYPVWRLMIRDDTVVAANTFQMGMRGTESSQVVLDMSRHELARAFAKVFETTWSGAAREIADEKDII